MFSHQVGAAIVQVLASLRGDAAALLFYKHLGYMPWPPDVHTFHQAFQDASDDQRVALVTDVLAHVASVKADAPTKYVFEERMTDARAWLLHDGFELVDGVLVQAAPAVEEATQLRNHLIELLAASPLDHDGKIRSMLEASKDAFGAQPPDVNAATTHVRIALETIARRAAPIFMAKANLNISTGTWGAAVSALVATAVLSKEEESGITAAYTFISPGAHVPLGLSELEWARLVRTIALSMCYFLMARFAAS